MSTGGTAELEMMVETVFEEQATGTHGPSTAALRQVAAERLAAHRHRRDRDRAVAEARQMEAQEADARQRQRLEAARTEARESQRRGFHSVREAVEARYRNTESYREYLAHEAERALAKAEAEAEVAARNVRAVAEAQMRLLEELEEQRDLEKSPREQALERSRHERREELAHALADIALGARELMAEPPVSLSLVEALPAPEEGETRPAVREISANGLTVRLFEDMPAAATRRSEVTARCGKDLQESPEVAALELAQSELDEEIEFRRAPEFLPVRFETTPIPANIIEFPRELIAPRKARPRIAEGPLRATEEPQMRIFEVAPELPFSAPDVVPELAAGWEEAVSVAAAEWQPDWQSLVLEPSAERLLAEAQRPMEPHGATLPLETCTLERRLMSISVDAICVLGGVLGFALSAGWVAGPMLRDLSLPLAALGVGGTFAVATVLYQALFFCFSDATPGMRFARLAFCTFGDGNPSRKALRRRVVTTVLAACPLGLGLLWALVDEDRLGWQDRMSRMYLRAY